MSNTPALLGGTIGASMATIAARGQGRFDVAIHAPTLARLEAAVEVLLLQRLGPEYSTESVFSGLEQLKPLLRPEAFEKIRAELLHVYVEDSNDTSFV